MRSRAASFFFVYMAFARVAGAQNADNAATSAREQERTALYREGVALAEAGRWEEARGKFERVVAIRSAPRALIALATAEEKSGRWTRAKHTYARTQTDAGASGEADLASEAAAALRGLESRMPHVTIRLSPAIANERVTLDGSPVDALSGPVEIDPGEHHIVVRPAQRPSFERVVRIDAGKSETVLIELPQEPVLFASSPAASPGEDHREASRSRAPPVGTWILGGAGLAATAVGLVVRAAGQAQYDEVADECGGRSCSSSDAVTRGNGARDRMLVGTVVTAAGAASLAGAGVWWAISAYRSPEPTRAGAMPIRDAWPDGWSFRVNGTF